LASCADREVTAAKTARASVEIDFLEFKRPSLSVKSQPEWNGKGMAVLMSDQFSKPNVIEMSLFYFTK
jgi:hypothetical protein